MTDKAEAMDLAKTLDELSKAAMVGVKTTGYKYFGDYELSADQWEAVDALVEFARFTTECIRTGKLVVVPDDAVERVQEAYATFGQTGDLRTTPPSRDCIMAMIAALKGADHAG